MITFSALATRPLNERPLRIATILWCACFCLISSVAVAQKVMQHVQLVAFVPSLDRTDEKFIRQAFRDQDPRAVISVDLGASLAKVKMLGQLDRAAFEAALASAGIVVSGYPNMQGSASETRALDDALPGFPVYVDTGDPQADEALYQTRKQAWFDTHPGGYPPSTVPVDEER